MASAISVGDVFLAVAEVDAVGGWGAEPLAVEVVDLRGV